MPELPVPQARLGPKIHIGEPTGQFSQQWCSVRALNTLLLERVLPKMVTQLERNHDKDAILFGSPDGISRHHTTILKSHTIS